MNDFNAILSKMKSWANAAGKKTEEVVEASKLKLQIVSLNGEISKAYEELGSLVYHAAKKNETIGEEMDVAMDKIDSLLEKLQELESKVGEIKKVRTCSNCGASCPTDAHFCSRCGMILAAMVPETSGGEEDDCQCECKCDCGCENSENCECECHSDDEGNCCCECHNNEGCHCECQCQPEEEGGCHCDCDCGCESEESEEKEEKTEE